MDKGKLKWRSRRGLRELDLLFRNFIEKNWDDITDIELEQYAAIVNFEDQPLFDYIFKDISLGNAELELFIDQRIKPYLN